LKLYNWSPIKTGAYCRWSTLFSKLGLLNLPRQWWKWN